MAAPRAPTRTFVTTPNALVSEIVAQVHAADLLAQVQWIVGLGVRSSRSPNLPAVADSLQAKLGSYGLTTQKHYFPLGTLSIPNVAATQVCRVNHVP